MNTHISASQEDYLESIYIIQSRRKLVRVKDIADFINVKAPSVIEALANLKKKDLVIHEPYRHIELTSKGLLKAKKLYEKHITLKKFFHDILGVKESIAEEDACKTEHHLSENTINKLLTFVNKFEKEISV